MAFAQFRQPQLRWVGTTLNAEKPLMVIMNRCRPIIAGVPKNTQLLFTCTAMNR
jgi:hypothetical protein